MGEDMGGVAIRVSGLRKSFGQSRAIDGIDLTVAEGSVFALLGPNGAGKTTTVQILSTLIHPDAGEVRVAGHDPVRDSEAVRKVIGLTGQSTAVDSLLTGEENLLLMADLHHLGREEGRRKVDELMQRMELADEARKPAATYSGGIRRRLDLAMTLIGDPQILFLDEPTTGLDPRSRRTVWSIVRELVEHGVTIFLTTHYLEEADKLADQVVLMDRGRVVADGTPEELKRLIPGGHVRLEFADEDTVRAARLALPEASDEDVLALRIPSDAGTDALRSALDRLAASSVAVERISIHTPDLDDVFLTLTGRPQGDEAA
jgi:ABC-2 type transport system ATP-binding protein